MGRALRAVVGWAFVTMLIPAGCGDGEQDKRTGKRPDTPPGRLAGAASGQAEDWPQWRGPNRDGVSTETGLLEKWPEGGPPLLWTITGLGPGYSSVAISRGRLYTMGDRGGDQLILAYDLATRKELWAAKVGQRHRGGGPRCTPTVDGAFVYALGAHGDLLCVEAATGRERWRKSFESDFGSPRAPHWKYSESPLIDGDRLICTPGASEALLVALDKTTGKTLWRCSVPESERHPRMHAQYSSVAVAEGGGVRQYVTLIASKGLVGVATQDGRFLWSYRRIVNGTANVPTAVVRGAHVFCSTAYGTGAALLKLTGEGIEEVYFLRARTFQNHHGGFVRIGDYIYGGHDHNKGKPTCIEMATGKVMWQEPQPGGGSAAVVCADGHLYFRYQDDTVALIQATPERYTLKGTFKLPQSRGMSGPGWAHPVVLDGKLFLRHADVLFCYDVRAR